MSLVTLAAAPIIVHKSNKFYHAELSDPTLSPISALVAELLVDVLLLGCGVYFGSRGRFLDNRGVFCLVCRRWRVAIISCGSFWSSYVFRPLRLRSTFELWTSRFHGHSLDLIVELDRYILWTSASVDQLTTDETIDALLSFLPACRRLVIEAADVIPLTRLTGLMSSIPMPRLHYLALISEPINSLAAMSNSYQPNYHAISVTHASAFVPIGLGPSFIRLSGLVLTWTHQMYYANVTTLILQYFSNSVAPTLVQLHSVLQSAAFVRRLSLSGICCEPSQAPLSGLSLPRLEDLHLRMACNASVGRLVSLFTAPKLRDLHVFIDGGPDMAVLLGCASLLRRVEYLVVDGDHCVRRSIVDLFGLMPDVLHCDMSLSSVVFFGALTSAGSAIFPVLRSLVLADMQFTDLKKFIVSRASEASFLDTLSVRYMYGPSMDNAQLEWIRERVGYFDLEPVWKKYWYHLN
ncbi:hypothetical protein C8R47DRAFT_1226697 [Mycena vitilis]|nr:hypothetical protein C8R47DRAFT_1226697 [Mycena vitilis]